MTELCQCDFIIDNDECQCSVKSSDCIRVDGSGRLVGLKAEPIIDPDPDNIYTKAVDGHLVALPSHIRNPDRCQIFHNTTQSIPNDTGTVVAFNSENWDTNTMHDTATLNTRVLVKTAGIYIAEARASFAANATGDRSLIIRKNGNEYLGGEEKKATSASFETGLKAKVHEWLMADEYLEVIAKQDSGGALNLVGYSGTNKYSPVFTVLFKRLPPNE